MAPVEDTQDRICQNITEAIGHTPMVYLNKVTEGLNAKIAVKLEYMNPACSVKDRPASHMIEVAEKEGKIKPGDVIIEPTSGNMGIGMAMACAVKGYKLILVMPSSMSLERRVLCKAYGAQVVITDAALGFKASFERAQELNKAIPNSFIPNQFANPANPQVHYLTTGPELWRQTEGKVELAVFGVGSAGTLTGVGTFLKEKNPNIKLYAAEPYESSVINGLPAAPHTIPGIGAGIIPDNLKPIYDEALRVKSADAVEMAKRLATEEGILSGISSGANVLAAIELAKRPENAGKLIVTCLPSFGERYLSTLLYKTIKDESEVLKITSLEEDKDNLNKLWGLSL
ncbi:unnamed protein product [Bursaphelenchus okinawaensis]|uniref:Cysteine synthase n=1 Tax=Bursaphelenchus okinawaensis TaxID=465554 RepID=A0A811JRE9_9BILA|nr:unnamed protein product [Bursaphelenchus okinawaensis]CAG9080085.1 unnamed protein product [Bursaphelenchus okinawaensis]